MKIQSLFRAFHSHKAVQHKRSLLVLRKEMVRIVKVQAHLRGLVCRRRYQRVLRMVLSLQSTYRSKHTNGRESWRSWYVRKYFSCHCMLFLLGLYYCRVHANSTYNLVSSHHHEHLYSRIHLSSCSIQLFLAHQQVRTHEPAVPPHDCPLPRLVRARTGPHQALCALSRLLQADAAVVAPARGSSKIQVRTSKLPRSTMEIC